LGERDLVRVSRWLDDEEFQELLKVADYVGRRDGYSIFRISRAKVARSGLTPVDVRSLLRDL